ncbi:hypothetical protein N7488_005233 [Penicillium malachiteum]|nr:hypothetical protein N7488_005233 [Penicillium malachiteum]
MAGTGDSVANTVENDTRQNIQQPTSTGDAPNASSLEDNGVKSGKGNERDEPTLMEKVKSLTKLTTSVSGNLVPSLRDKLRQLQREKLQWEKERAELKDHIADLELAVTNAHSELSMINELLATHLG